jgi:hypothetical protein
VERQDVMRSQPRVTERVRTFAAWYFRNPDTGEVVLWEKPNRRLTAYWCLRAGRWLLHRVGLPRHSPLDVALARTTAAVLVVWAADEAVRGNSPYRCTIGAASLLYGVRSWRKAP